MVTLFDSTTIGERLKESAWIDFLGEMNAFELGCVNVFIFRCDDDEEEEEEFDDDQPSLRLSKRDNYYGYTLGELLSRIDDWDEICVYIDDSDRLIAEYSYGKLRREITFYVVSYDGRIIPLGPTALECLESDGEEEEVEDCEEVS